MTSIYGYVSILALPIATVIPQAAISKNGPLKNMDPVYARKLEVARRSVAPFEARAKEEMAKGDFAAALDSFGSARKAWRSTGLAIKVDYLGERIECLYGLNRYRDLVTIYDAKPIKSPVFGIALIHVGRSMEARSFYSDESVLSYLSTGNYRQAMPGTRDDAHLEASFRLARAADLFFKAANERAKRELLVADRLVPNQPMVSYFLVETCFRTRDWNEVARALPAAMKLNGVVGRQVAEIARTMPPSPKRR